MTAATVYEEGFAVLHRPGCPKRFTKMGLQPAASRAIAEMFLDRKPRCNKECIVVKTTSSYVPVHFIRASALERLEKRRAARRRQTRGIRRGFAS